MLENIKLNMVTITVDCIVDVKTKDNKLVSILQVGKRKYQSIIFVAGEIDHSGNLVTLEVLEKLVEDFYSKNVN